MNAALARRDAWGADPAPARACPQKPIPKGWKVWRGPVPELLRRFAIDVRDHIALYAYDQIAVTTVWQGVTVAAYKSRHTWTYRPEGLVTDICIPGVSLIVPITASLLASAGADIAAAPTTSLATPDPDLAVWTADPAGGAPLLWTGLTAMLTVATVAGAL